MKKLQTKKSISCYAELYLAIWCFCLMYVVENKKTHTSQCEPKQTVLVTSAGLEPATF